MSGYEYAIMFLVVVSAVFFALGFVNRRNDVGLTSTYYSIGIIILIVAVLILFLVLNDLRLHIPEDEEQ